MSKSICHIINSLHQGGAETILYRLIKSDKINKHYVICLTELGFYGEKFKNCLKNIQS